MKTVIEMALEAGFESHDISLNFPKELERFAGLVRADEREACAKVCDDLDDDLPDGLAGWQYGEAIRARGNK